MNEQKRAFVVRMDQRESRHDTLASALVCGVMWTIRDSRTAEVRVAGTMLCTVESGVFRYDDAEIDIDEVVRRSHAVLNPGAES